MSGRVYLLSTLPHLNIASFFSDDVLSEKNNPTYVPSIEDFRAVCNTTLSVSDVNQVYCAMDRPSESSIPFVDEYTEYSFALVDAIAKKRWEHSREGVYTHTIQNNRVPISADAANIVAHALAAKSPLEREGIVGKALWSYLEFCDAHYRFALENIIVYGYKLQLYYRFCKFTHVRGKTAWEEIVNALVDKAGFSRGAIRGGNE